MLNDVDMKQLRALHAVVTQGSFGRAAALLGFTQSAISQQIASLERAIGDRVFDRPGGPRRVLLTPIGEVLFAHAEAMSQRQVALEAELRDLRAGQIGSLSVGSFQSVSVRILPEVLGLLRRERPRLAIRCEENDQPDSQVASVRAGTFDLAFVVGEFDEADLESLRIGVDPYVLVSPLSDPVQHAIHDLRGVPMIGQRAGTCQATLDGVLLRLAIELDYVFRSDDNAAVQAMVRAGMGHAILPLLAVDTSDTGVRISTLQPEVPPRVISIVRSRERTLNVAADRFVELAQRVGASAMMTDAVVARSAVLVP